MGKPWEIYDLMMDIVASEDAMIEELIVGLTWTYCRSSAVGLCMTADSRSRTFEWPGKIKGQSALKLADWIRDWDPMKSNIGMAVINSMINQPSLKNSVKPIPIANVLLPNLSVFEYFLPVIKNKRCVVIGHYPGIETIQQHCTMEIIELNPRLGDLPATACEYVLPEAEWVFLSGTSIANKTFPRLMELSQNANVVLMGPTVPWITELSEFGVDFLCGVEVKNYQQLKQTIAEGGGVNIFSDSVQYGLVDLGKQKMRYTRNKISTIVNQREVLKDEMGAWYQVAGNVSYPKSLELVALDEELSDLDSQYKKMWDLRQNFAS